MRWWWVVVIGMCNLQSAAQVERMEHFCSQLEKTQHTHSHTHTLISTSCVPVLASHVKVIISSPPCLYIIYTHHTHAAPVVEIGGG